MYPIFGHKYLLERREWMWIKFRQRSKDRHTRQEFNWTCGFNPLPAADDACRSFNTQSSGASIPETRQWPLLFEKRKTANIKFWSQIRYVLAIHLKYQAPFWQIQSFWNIKSPFWRIKKYQPSSWRIKSLPRFCDVIPFSYKKDLPPLACGISRRPPIRYQALAS